MIAFIAGLVVGFLFAAWLAHYYLHTRICDLEDSLHARLGRVEDSIRAEVKKVENAFTRRPSLPPSAPQHGGATTATPAGASDSPPAAAPAG